MYTVGIAKLKNNLSYYIDKIRKGAEILVTDHGKPVAKLSPPAKTDEASSLDEKIKAGVEAGWLYHDFSSRKKNRFRKHKLIKLPGENTASRFLIEEIRKDRV